MLEQRLHIPTKELEKFCRKYHIKKLAFFGSVLDESFMEISDIDVLVTFKKNHTPGFLQLAKMESELSSILGRKADIRTSEDLSLYFRSEVESKAVVKYADG